MSEINEIVASVNKMEELAATLAIVCNISALSINIFSYQNLNHSMVIEINSFPKEFSIIFTVAKIV